MMKGIYFHLCLLCEVDEILLTVTILFLKFFGLELWGPNRFMDIVSLNQMCLITTPDANKISNISQEPKC